MTTPDPAVIAANLGKRERDLLLVMGDSIPFIGKWASSMRLELNGLAAWRHIGRIRTPLGRAVAAAIREQTK